MRAAADGLCAQMSDGVQFKHVSLDDRRECLSALKSLTAHRRHGRVAA